MADRANGTFDLVVIGAGAAGSTVAGEAIGRGARVAMIERWKVGGTCLNVGCDPTKTMVRSAEVLHLAHHARRFGIQVENPRGDWPAVMDRVDRIIDTIRGGDGDQNIRDSGVALYKGEGRFLGPHEISVEGTRLHAAKVIIATGATGRVPPIPGLREAGFITNRDAVALPELPRSLAIIGGGVIGVEFAQIFARFGVEVTLFSRAAHILPHEDTELTGALRTVLEREGVRIETEAPVRRVTAEDGRKRLTAERDGDAIVCEAEEILLAAGRVPALDALNLAAAGVASDASGIAVDATMRTNVPHVWAVGDVVAGGYPFTHVADYQARAAEHNAMSGMPPRHVDYRAVPWATFTDPELARVGLTEPEAIAAGHDIKCATVAMRDLARALTAGETDGLVKLVSDRATGRLLGGHILAARGGELLGEVALTMRLRLPVSAIAETIHAYPTLSEAVFWAAYELAKPDDSAMDAVRGVQSPLGQLIEEM